MIIDCHTHNIAAADAIISVAPQVALHGVALHGSSRLSVGLHPWHLSDCNDIDLALLERVAILPEVVAIGETGLDTLRGPAMDVQIKVLRHHILLAETLGKPIIAHCVRASNQLVKIWRETAPHRVPMIIHGFHANENVASNLLDAGFYLSYGMKFNHEALRITPQDRMLAETDDNPESISQVITAMAAVLDQQPSVLTARIADNLIDLLPSLN